MAAQPEMTQTQPAERLLALVESFVRETRPSRAPRVTLDRPGRSAIIPGIVTVRSNGCNFTGPDFKPMFRCACK